MADDGLSSRTARKTDINSKQFRRTEAEKLRAVDAKELRDVTAGDLEEMYKTTERRDKE